MATHAAATGSAKAAIAVAALLALVLAACDSGPPDRSRVRATPVTVTGSSAIVDIDDSDYEPAALRVKPGTTVTWQFNDSVSHDVAEDEGLFKSDVMSDGEFSYTFEQAGEYFYYCTVHPRMQGVIVVEANAAPATSTP